jgi:hypothetical protein
MKDVESDEIAELQDELICKGGPKVGKPKAGADPEKLARLQELLDKQRDEGSDEQAPTPPAEPTPTIDEPAPAEPQIKKQTPELEKLKVVYENQIKKMLGTPAAKKATGSPEVTSLEREIRRYVKKSGGFRTDLSPAAKREAQRLLRKAGRNEPVWNTRISVPGYDR